MHFILEENKVIWNSNAMMAACDLLVIGFAILIFAKAVKHGQAAGRSSDARGSWLIVAAVFLTGIFCAADLTTMFILQHFVGEEKAYITIDYLHLNVRTVITAITVALTFIGFVQLLSYRKKTAMAIGCLTTKLAHCEEHERCRIANYLHDHIGQSLAALRIKFDMISLGGTETGTKLFTKLLDETIERTESLTYELHPPVLSQFGLRAAIEWLSNKFSSEYSVRFECSVEGTPLEIDEDDAALLFRIGRELMFNVIKHAHTDSARVTLRWHDEAVSIEVEDEGVGYDPSVLVSTGEELRFGLTSVRGRVTALGGSYDVDTQLGDGTRVAINIPLNSSAMRLADAMA